MKSAGWIKALRKNSPSHFFKAGASRCVCGRQVCVSDERTALCPGYKCLECLQVLQYEASAAHVGGAKGGSERGE